MGSVLAGVQALGATGIPAFLMSGSCCHFLRVTPQHVIIGRDGRVEYVGWLVDQRLEDALTAAWTAGDSKLSLHAETTSAKPQYYAVGDRLPKMPEALKSTSGK